MTGVVSNDLWIRLEKALSTERLSSYSQPGDTDHDQAVARYMWNSALCESLYPMLNSVEIAARNRLDSAITHRLGDRWIENDMLLSGAEIARVSEAKDSLNRRGNAAPTHSEIVSELSLGFWVALFNKYYERPDKLWPRFSPDIMSGAPKSERVRGNFSTRMTELRQLRNRAFHHEPLWYWQDLRDQHKRGCQLLSWLSPESANLLPLIDRFEEVYERGFDAYECLLESGSICPIHNVGCRYVQSGQCGESPIATSDEPVSSL